MRTLRQRRGALAENVAAEFLSALGWSIVARNATVPPHDEIDIVAIDGGELVCVEVRSAHSSAFGAPEERVDRRKVVHLYRAARAFSRSVEARELPIGAMSVRVDLVVVDLRGQTPVIRHLRSLEPT